MSRPALICRSSTSATAVADSCCSACSSMRSPASCRSSRSESRDGRGRLPQCVVRMRSLLVSMLVLLNAGALDDVLVELELFAEERVECGGTRADRIDLDVGVAL